MEHKKLVAIEIGSSKIVGAVGAIDETGTLKVSAIEERALVDCVRYGWIQNVEGVKAAVADIITAFEERVNIAPSKVKGVYVALGGRSMMSHKREIERVFDTEIEITSEVIKQLDGDIRLEELEDKEIVDAVPVKYAVNNLAQQKPVGIYGNNIKASYNIIACRPQIKKNIDRVIEERLQLDTNGYIVRQKALAQLVLSDDDTKLGCVLVDLGAETTTVSIHKSGALQYMVTLPMGSRNITRDLSTLGITEEVAERLKCQYGNANSQETIGQGGQSSIIEGVDDSVFHNIVQHRAGEIAFNIATQITQAGFKSTDLASGGIVIVGQGAKLQGFSQLLEFHTSLKVRNGIIATPIHITDGSIQPGNALDVIAILLAASKKEDVVNCIEGQSQPLPEPEVIIEYGTPQVEEKEEEVEEEYEDIPEDKDPKPAGPSTMQKVGNRLKSMLVQVQDTVADYLKEDGYEK